MDYLREVNFWSILVRVLLSMLIGGILGIERGQKKRPAGFRTYMLVCLGSALVMMTNQYANLYCGAGDPVRMGAQVVSGIGYHCPDRQDPCSRNYYSGRPVDGSVQWPCHRDWIL